MLKLDVTDQGQIDAAIKAAEDRFGRIDVLVNNAGIGYFAAVEEGEEKQVRQMFEINVFGLSRMIRAALPGMRKRRKDSSSISLPWADFVRSRPSATTARRSLPLKVCRGPLAGGGAPGHQGDARRTERLSHRLGRAFGK